MNKNEVKDAEKRTIYLLFETETGTLMLLTSLRPWIFSAVLKFIDSRVWWVVWTIGFNNGPHTVL